MGVHAEPSLIHTLPGACGLSSLRDEVQRLPGGWTHSRSLGTLPRLVPVVSAPSEMRCGSSPVDGLTPQSLGTLPGHWAHSWSLGTLPRMVPVVSAPSKMRCAQSPDGWCSGEETGAVAAGEFPKVPQRVFFFLRKSSCSILWLPLYKEGPVLSHSPPLQLGRGLSGSGSHAAQLSTLLGQRLRSPWVFHFVLIPLPATSGNQVSHSVAQALFGSGGGL